MNIATNLQSHSNISNDFNFFLLLVYQYVIPNYVFVPKGNPYK